jgi:hypothetical protein
MFTVTHDMDAKPFHGIRQGVHFHLAGIARARIHVNQTRFSVFIDGFPQKA